MTAVGPLANNFLTDYFADRVKSKLIESQMYFCLTGMFTESVTKSIIKANIDQRSAGWHDLIVYLIVRNRHQCSGQWNGRFEVTVIQFWLKTSFGKK